MKNDLNPQELFSIQSACSEFNREHPQRTWFEQMQLREACRNDFARIIQRNLLGEEVYDISSS